MTGVRTRSRQERRDSSREKEASGFGFAVEVDPMGNESGYESEPGYRGDVELGYGDEYDDEEEDVKLLFWGDAPAFAVVLNFLLPLAVPLLLFRADLRRVVQSTGKLLLAFLIGSMSLVNHFQELQFVLVLVIDGYKCFLSL
ncbi:hypothetical protein F2Q69_00041610 [Brassica cretica]|uniref:Uncharacterized protein n=1 Tax=Brassica cretica TaxID=69181 RepID=A0A8S9NIX3_BRACR|nr:hypothetical protein F2Q69_00041610 [Brassica cretica]